MTIKACTKAALAALLLAFGFACAKQPAPPQEEPAPPAAKSTVVLLAEEDGSVGKVTVRLRSGGSRLLESAQTKIDVLEDGTLSAPTAVSQKELRERYAPVLDAMPAPPEHFVLYFKGKTNRLDAASTKLLADIERACKERGCRFISVIGHTDRVGDHDYNMVVSTRRAETVALMLEKRGIPIDIMEITSHGENNPLVPTEDGKANAQNKRVEVVIR